MMMLLARGSRQEEGHIWGEDSKFEVLSIYGEISSQQLDIKYHSSNEGDLVLDIIFMITEDDI